MIINLAKIRFGGNTGGGTPAKPEETFDITPTNSDITVVPTGANSVFSGGVVRGYDVDPIYNALDDLNTGDPTAPSAINFSIIGWSSEDSNAWNNDINAKVAYSKTKYDEWDPSKTEANHLYEYDNHLVFAPGIDTSNVTNMNYMFNECSSLQSIPHLDTSNVTSMYAIFASCSSLQSIPLLDTSNVTNMDSMFNRCKSLTSIPLLDTSNVTSMAGMFNECSSLTSIPPLDTSKVTDMSNMFYGCSSLASISQLDMSNVTRAGGIFNSCSNLESVPALDTSKCTDISYLFEACYNLKDIWGIDFSSVESDTIGLAWNIGSPINLRLTGCLNHNFDIANCSSNLNYESIKSILEAMNRTTNTNAKTMKFNRTITDQNGELASLVSSCTTKGWTVEGLTIN